MSPWIDLTALHVTRSGQNAQVLTTRVLSVGFFTRPGVTLGYECVNNAACNQKTLKPTLSHLTKSFSSFTMNTTVFIGGRNDLNVDRNFVGKVAGLIISTPAVPYKAVQCLYKSVYGELPTPMQQCGAMLAEMKLGHNFLMDFPLLHGHLARP